MAIRKTYMLIPIFLIVLASQINYMNTLDREMKSQEVEEYYSDLTTTFKILGIKRFGASILWAKQTLNIGETIERDAREDIKYNSLAIANLNPYFLENYFSSSAVLGLIRTYLDYEGALEILEFGMGYNLENTYLKSYYGGIAANSKGDSVEVIKNFEKIVDKYPDPQLLNILIGLYELRVAEFNKLEDKKKLIEYLIMLYNLNDSRYQGRVEEKLETLNML